MHEANEVEAHEMARDEPIYVVFDVPVTTTADEAARLLNEPYERGFYIHSVAPWLGQNGIGVRVFAKRITHPRSAKQLTPPNPPLPQNSKTAATDALRTLVAAYPQMSVSKLRATLRKLGHGKGHTWVHETRAVILGTAHGV